MTRKLLNILFLLSSGLVIASESDTLHFEWLGDSINGSYIEKSAMIIPVQILDDSNEYYFQFDTGANKSSVYVGDKYEKNSGITFSNSLELKTNLGTIEVDTLSYMSPFIDNNKLIVGTIGSDVLRDKVIRIDFINQTVVVSNDSNTEIFSFYPMTLSYGRPVIELKLAKFNYNFLFDTGSSIFDLWTSKKIWRKLAFRSSAPTELSIWSWGNINKVYSSPLTSQISFFECSDIEVNHVSYSSNKMYQKNFKQAGVDGVIGNKPFLSNIVLLDYKTMQIGLKKCKEN